MVSIQHVRAYRSQGVGIDVPKQDRASDPTRQKGGKGEPFEGGVSEEAEGLSDRLRDPVEMTRSRIRCSTHVGLILIQMVQEKDEDGGRDAKLTTERGGREGDVGLRGGVSNTVYYGDMIGCDVSPARSCWKCRCLRSASC